MTRNLSSDAIITRRTGARASAGFRDQAMPVELLRDHCGPYGIGVSDEFDHEAIAWRCGADQDPFIDRTPRPLIMRPDYFEHTKPPYYGAVLQKIAGGFRNGPFCHSTEEHLRQFIHHEALRHAGLPWPPPDHRERWWSKDKAQQARNRGIYHGLRALSLCAINRLIGELLEEVNQPKPVLAARRFTFRYREDIYRAAAQSSRALQFIDVFPIAGIAIYANWWPHGLDDGASLVSAEYKQFLFERARRRQEAKNLVERGARLRDVAAALNFPIVLRHVKPGAAHHISGVFVDRPGLLQYMPAATSASRLWLRSVHYAQNQGGADYATWVARHVPEMPHRQVVRTVTDLKDWVLANKGKDGRKFVTRRFNPAMGLRAAVEASQQWHEAVASNMDCAAGGSALPPPWYSAAKVGTFEIIPIETAADLVCEGYALHHCVGTYADSVRTGRCYVFSIRQNGQRIATLSLIRDDNGKQSIGQISASCNAEPPKAVTTAVQKWLRAQPAPIIQPR